MRIPKEILEDYLSWSEHMRYEYVKELLNDIFRAKRDGIYEYHKIKKKKLGIKWNGQRIIKFI